MTQQPPRCHYDRSIGGRVTRGHLDDCPDPQACDGCDPCLHPHCSVCARVHLDDAHPNTCPDCVSSIREDLDEIARHVNGLAAQAIDAGDDGRRWAAAPIPGALATVLRGPAVHPAKVRTRVDERRDDLLSPLVVLGHAEDVWRRWLGQPTRRTASVQASVDYLDEQLTLIAQARPDMRDGHFVNPPEFPEFARAIGHLRADLEHVLHDEQTPERGVDCFECGARLVRRIRDPKRCRHETEARTRFAERLIAAAYGQDWLDTLATYGLRPTDEERNAARRPSPRMVAAARMPCPRCNQGGVDDPRPKMSWECPSCRKVYQPEEYSRALRQALLRDNDAGRKAAGWSSFPVAAEAASAITGRVVTAATIRKWITRGDEIATLCEWWEGARFTRQLVFWPDVSVRASEFRSPGRRGRVA